MKTRGLFARHGFFVSLLRLLRVASSLDYFQSCPGEGALSMGLRRKFIFRGKTPKKLTFVRSTPCRRAALRTPRS